MKNRAISIVTTLISTVVICSTIAAFLLILRNNSAPSDGMPPNKGVVNEVLYSPDKTTFSIWAPIADSVILSLYEGRKASTPYTILPMQRGRDGVWTRRVNGDLNGLLYSFKIMSGGEWHDDIPGIFAIATTNGGKRAAVVDMQAVNPEEWEKDTSPHIESLSDAVIMEVDTRSFSLKEENNIEYLRRIGATHINILPSFYFASIDGYRRPERMIKEFKETVMALHKAGMRVVINISYENISELALEHFKAVTPEFTPQMNEMMRRYMVESVRRWINEYHVDGFRFLQMGSHEIETLNKIRKAADAIDPNILIYGEGWRSSTHIADLNNAAIKSNTYKMVGISSFSDEFRDAITGSFAYHGSFLSGAPDTRESLKFGIAGACRHPQIDFSKVNRSNRPWARAPFQMISYLNTSKELSVTEKLRITMPELTQSELLRLEKIAQTLIFTSQGTPFISAGDPHDIETFRRDLYYSKLIELRKAHPAFRMKSAEMVSKNIFFFPTSSDNLFAFMIDGSECGDTSEKIIVAFNTGKNKSIMEIPEGEYKVVCAKGRIDTNGLYKISGSSLHVGPMQAVILCSV